jgi:hypothetical protein
MKASKLFSISSRDAVRSNAPMNSNCIFDIETFVDTSPQVSFMEISIVQLQIPCSFYLVNATNNTFVVDNKTYFVPLGNYNIKTMQTQLRELLPPSFAVGYSGRTGKITLANSAQFVVAATSSIHEILGLSTQNDMVSVFSGGAWTLEFPNIINFFPHSRINVLMPELKIQNYSTHNHCDSPVIASIPNMASQDGQVLYSNAHVKFLLPKMDLHTFGIQLKDEYSNFIHLNGAHWFLTLYLETHYNATPFNTLHFDTVMDTNRKRAFHELENEENGASFGTEDPSAFDAAI